MSNETASRAARACITVLLAIAALTAVFPFYFMVVTSLKLTPEYYQNLVGIPAHPTIENYGKLFRQFPVLKMALNSGIVNAGMLLASTFICSLAGFVFAKFPYPGSRQIFTGIVACMMVPPVVLIIPVYLMMSSLHLINTYASLMLFYTAMVIPFSIYLISANYRMMPDEILEAARLDGAGLFGIYRHVVLPLGKSVLLTLLTLNFLWGWNEFLYSLLFLQTNELRTLTVGVAIIIGKRVVDTPLLITGLLVNSIPVLLVFSFANKYLVRGLVAGAIKG
jgi:raffinose/stachyose/melibiose transport system permease protein